MARVRIDQAKVRALIMAPGSMGQRWLYQLGNRVKNGAQERCNVRTGRLRSSIRLVPLPNTARVGTDVKYSAAVHDGSRPHVIEARPRPPKPGSTRARGYLRFEGRDGIVYARRVNHPGYKGNPFLLDALREQIGRL